VSTGEHWTSDVLAGDLVGVAGIAAAHLLPRVTDAARRPPRAHGVRTTAA
jgi:hypothetical protein